MKCPIDKSNKRKNKKKLNMHSQEETNIVGNMRAHEGSSGAQQCKEGRHFTEGFGEKSEVRFCEIFQEK